MAQIIVKYPIGYSMVNEKPVANNKIADKICKQFDKGKSVSLPNSDGWEVILSGQALQDPPANSLEGVING